MTVGPGEFVALLGPSGAGKSSLFKLMNRLKSPTSGTIYWHDQAIETLPVVQLRQQVMLVGQEYRLLGMTVYDALQYPLKLQGVAPPQRQARILPWLERLQIPEEWLHRTELDLSGGQRQRVAIARGLVAAPTILLLDEPTSAQDFGYATHLLSVIKTQVKDQGLSVIMSNHQLELAQAVCDRILYLDQGRLLADQSAATVDWQALRQQLLSATTQDYDEWGDV